MTKRAVNTSSGSADAQNTDEARTSEIARSVVRRTATGNVRLQIGDFMTKSDLDRQFERIKNHRFVSG